MRRNRSFIQSIFLKIHYKTSLALVSVFLGVLAFSGFYFFGQNIVNEADQIQRASRERMSNIKLTEEKESNTNSTSDISPTISKDSTTPTAIGGTGVSPTEVVMSPTPLVPTATSTPTVTPFSAKPLDSSSFLLGDPNAEKTILAYYDFECKFCKAFIDETLPLLKQEYLNTGKAKMIFKNFPLTSHPNAPIVHNAAVCASLDGNFWKFHDIIFENQSEWSDKSALQTTTSMKSYYETEFGSSTSFVSCVDNNLYGNQIDKDKIEGKNAGVTGTPTFILGEEILVGHQSIDTFRQILNK
jgi:protein-disulfide isomerase